MGQEVRVERLAGRVGVHQSGGQDDKVSDRVRSVGGVDADEHTHRWQDHSITRVTPVNEELENSSDER